MRTNHTMAAALESIAMELHLKGEPAESSPYGSEWKCPLCGNIFSLIDGTRTCTHNPDCPCPSMPEPLRVFRAARDSRWAAEKADKSSSGRRRTLGLEEVQKRLEAARNEVAKLEQEQNRMQAEGHGVLCRRERFKKEYLCKPFPDDEALQKPDPRGYSLAEAMQACNGGEL